MWYIRIIKIILYAVAKVILKSVAELSGTNTAIYLKFKEVHPICLDTKWRTCAVSIVATT